MEAIGTASALAELLGLSIKTSKAAKSLVQSFMNAPDELVRLAEKIDHLHLRIEQLHHLGEELPVSDSLVLLPPEHQTILSSGLQNNLDALQMVQSLCSARSGTSQTVRARLRWAALDKRRAEQILGKVATTESQLNSLLAILGARLTCLNQMSLQALSASQTLLQEELRESIETVKASLHAEIQSVIEISTQSPLKSLTAAESTSDEEIQSIRSGDHLNPNLNIPRQNQHSVQELCGVDLQSASQRRLDQDGQRKLQKPVIRTFSSPENEEVDPGVRLIQHHMRRSLFYYSREYGSLRELPTSDKRRVGAMVTVQSKRARRRLRFVLEIGFNVICQQVLRFELNLQQAARHWLGMPRFDCSVTMFNVRPKDAPIFQACRQSDLSRVRYLLGSGQATIFDCDDEIGGLLEHVLQGTYLFLTPDNRELRQILEHLLDEGCDPNAFYGTITEQRLPAVLFAFEWGYSSAVSALLSRGADIISFGPLVAGLLGKRNAGFKWKVELLRGTGFCDWKAELPAASGFSNSMLHGACEEGDFQELLFALEIAQLDPNLEGEFRHTPLGNAAKINFLEGVAVLLECGAEIDSGKYSVYGSPLIRSLRWPAWPTNTTHYLLRWGANSHLKSSYGETIWNPIWNRSIFIVEHQPTKWSFISLEGGLAHVLLHGLDPFQLFLDPDLPYKSIIPPDHWHSSVLYFRTPEILRSWSYGIRPEHSTTATWKEWITKFESSEETRTPQFDICWSPAGLVYQKPSDNSQCAQGTEAADDTEGEGEDETFFQRQTQFYHHISSPEGRRLLSRFPKVLAFCDALQFAGYRAEMDEEGDIWYEIGDGDRYFDAREYHDEDDEDSPTEFCPICQDFEGHGLGHILQKTEWAKQQLWEYREKVKAAKTNFRSM
ncbi:hypothetical protein F5Y06DRAFT_273291 [Hypoxylon sp. FL0890]|nr:hypothetical protein F5Y06DRAFT_273291 [Hypoxylon sp. FL0890]